MSVLSPLVPICDYFTSSDHGLAFFFNFIGQTVNLGEDEWGSLADMIRSGVPAGMYERSLFKLEYIFRNFCPHCAIQWASSMTTNVMYFDQLASRNNSTFSKHISGEARSIWYFLACTFPSAVCLH